MVTWDTVHAHSTRLGEKLATAALTAAPGLCDYRDTRSPQNISFSVLFLADSLQAQIWEMVVLDVYHQNWNVKY